GLSFVGYELHLVCYCPVPFFFFSSRRRHTRSTRDWSSDVCSSDLYRAQGGDGLIERGESLRQAARTGQKAGAFEIQIEGGLAGRSEERRVGKEYIYMRAEDHKKKNI